MIQSTTVSLYWRAGVYATLHMLCHTLGERHRRSGFTSSMFPCARVNYRDMDQNLPGVVTDSRETFDTRLQQTVD